MTLSIFKRYRNFILLVIVVIIIVAVFKLDEDRTVVNWIRYALKGIKRAL